VEGVPCLLEALDDVLCVPKLLEVVKDVRLLLCTGVREGRVACAVDAGSDALCGIDAGGATWCTLCAALYSGGCGGCVLFAGNARGVALYAGGYWEGERAPFAGYAREDTLYAALYAEARGDASYVLELLECKRLCITGAGGPYAVCCSECRRSRRVRSMLEAMEGVLYLPEVQDGVRCVLVCMLYAVEGARMCCGC
jgi:hypothetical protein